MSIQSVFLFKPVETFKPLKGSSAYAIQLSSALSAKLTALVLELDVVTPKSWTNIDDGPNAEPQTYTATAPSVAETLRLATHEAGIPSKFITEHSHAQTVPTVIVDLARIADISVTGIDGSGLLSELMLAESILFQSGRPLIVVPHHYDQAYKCDHIVVAWDFGRNAARALGDALPFLHRAKSVSIITFGDDKELESSLTGDDLVASLAERGIDARYERVDRGGKSIDAALNDLALAQKADLMVMGGYGHSRFREFVLGGATRGILRNLVVPTLLSH